MIYEVFISTDNANVFESHKYCNQSVAKLIYEAAFKWGRFAFVLTYPQ